jgi:chromate reductase, NAD(P)H dehydrogenase (quinone)
VKILAISGSLRAASSNTALLEAARVAAPSGVDVELWTSLDTLPHFNPDLDVDDPEALPATVRDLRRRVGAADALLLSSPEYARGIPGSFKNALDWLVRSTEFPGKTVVLLNPSTRSMHAIEQLLLVLSTMSARLTDPSTFAIQLPRRDITAADIAADPTLVATIRSAFAAVQATVRAVNTAAKNPRAPRD